MKRTNMLIPRVVLAVLVSFIISCEKDKENNGPVDLEIILEYQVDNDPLELDTIQYINTAGNHYSVTTLKYFISNIQLQKAGGGILPITDVVYVDASEDNSFTYPDVLIKGDAYTGVHFTFGLDSVMNTSSRFPSPPESNMEWPFTMGGGYHYMKLEGKHDSSGTIKSYNVHTGALMGTSYSFDVNLAGSSFEASGNTLTLTLVMDINNWFDIPNVYDFNVYGPAIMGNATAQKVISENGANVFSIKSIE